MSKIFWLFFLAFAFLQPAQAFTPLPGDVQLDTTAKGGNGASTVAPSEHNTVQCNFQRTCHWSITAGHTVTVEHFSGVFLSI